MLAEEVKHWIKCEHENLDHSCCCCSLAQTLRECVVLPGNTAQLKPTVSKIIAAEHPVCPRFISNGTCEGAERSGGTESLPWRTQAADSSLAFPCRATSLTCCSCLLPVSVMHRPLCIYSMQMLYLYLISHHFVDISGKWLKKCKTFFM